MEDLEAHSRLLGALFFPIPLLYILFPSPAKAIQFLSLSYACDFWKQFCFEHALGSTHLLPQASNIRISTKLLACSFKKKSDYSFPHHCYWNCIYIKREDANGSACSMNVSHPPPSPLCWSGSAVINPGCTWQPCEELLKTQVSGPRFQTFWFKWWSPYMHWFFLSTEAIQLYTSG